MGESYLRYMRCYFTKRRPKITTNQVRFHGYKFHALVESNLDTSIIFSIELQNTEWDSTCLI